MQMVSSLIAESHSGLEIKGSFNGRFYTQSGFTVISIIS